FQHAGFRYVASDQALQQFPSNYESDQLVSQYLEFQYGTEYFGVANFAQTLVHLAQPYFQETSCHRAMDIGCATGRASFELARYFDQVTGLDFSARFIQQAAYLAQGHRVRYQLPLEGELSDEKSCSLEGIDRVQLATKT